MATPTTDTTPTGMGCQVGEVFQLLSRAHMLDILHLVTQETEGALRFGDVEEALGVSPNTLSQRLKEMVAAGLLDRTSYKEIPPRVEYEATEKALDLCPVFNEIHAWAERHEL